MLQLIIILSLLITTILICFKKWSWLDWYAAHRKQWMPKSDCYLCLSFHLSIILLIFISLAKGFNIEYIISPFCIAALSNFLINNAILHENNRS